jgi:hypothetical protein
MKFLNFCLFLWVIFALLDPDPDSESGSTDLIESGSNPDRDPDLKHWPETERRVRFAQHHASVRFSTTRARDSS